MLENRWKNLMKSFRFKENESALSILIKKYQQKHRAYHNLDHVVDCLHQLDRYKDEIDDIKIIELAIWYHDIIYNPYKKDNEQKSAEASSEFLLRQNANSQLIQKVYDLILSTIHIKPPKNKSEAIIMDIDITILGSSEERYGEYCAKIRKEYKWVPNIIYRKKRKEIMTRFLDRKQLYFTDYFYSSLEKRARFNISQEIQRLN